MAFDPIETLVRFDGGANTRDFADNIAKNQSPNPRGVQLVGSSMRKAPGYRVYGIEPDADQIGKTLYSHRILSSTELLIKSIGTTLKFLDPVTNTYHRFTTATLTANKRWLFTSFNGYLYGGNGVDNFIRVRFSAYSTLANPVAPAATTIDLAPGTGARYPNAGSGLIEGDDFSWSGRTVDQLTGVTGVTSAHVAGSTVVMAADTTTYSSNPKGSVGVFYKNRNWVRDDSNPNFYYYSKLADNTTPEDDLANFSVAGSGAGDAGYMIFPAPLLSAKVFITGGNEPVHLVFCADGIVYAVNIVDSGSTTVASYTQFKVAGADLVSQRAVAVTENDLLFIDIYNNLRSLGYGDQSTTIKTERISDEIFPTMEDADFSDGVVEYLNRRVYIIGKQKGAEQNNFTIVRETNPAGFVFWDHLQLNDVTESNNILLGLSSITGNVYQLEYGYDADGKKIYSSYPLPALDHGVPLILKKLSMVRISGYITNNCKLYYKMYPDESSTPTTFLIAGDNTDIVAAPGNVSVGTVVFGQAVVGGGLGDGIALRKFVATLTLDSFTLYYVLNSLFENNQSGADFAIDKMLFFVDRQSATLDREDDQILAPS